MLPVIYDKVIKFKNGKWKLDEPRGNLWVTPKSHAKPANDIMPKITYEDIVAIPSLVMGLSIIEALFAFIEDMRKDDQCSVLLLIQRKIGQRVDAWKKM